VSTTGDDAPFRGKIGDTWQESQAWWPEPAAAPAGAPNVVCIVLDDVGFSDIGCYGSEIATPRIDALAARGLRYSNFHVTAMCSPTRACLLTGRNAHAVGVGIISEWSSGFPGYQGRVTRKAATVPEILREHGYGTYAVGKWHLTNTADYGAAGSREDWPLGRGFNRWYGFHGALADQWHPELYQDNRAVAPPAAPGYHLSGDLVEHAIADIRDHRANAPERPFFQYVAFGACHWPHHVPAEHLARQRGRYDIGWDAVREARLARQKALGIVPQETRLAPRNPGVQAWDTLSPDIRRLCARLQETYAAFLEHTDEQIGRLIDALGAFGCLEDTLILLMSDNGASAEGGPTGAINLRKHMVYEEESPEVGLARLDKIGGPEAFNHYPQGWAQVSNTPLKWYKKDTHGGGIRAPLVAHWPRRIASGGEIRDQFHHVIDIAPTLYELLGIEAAQSFVGVPQLPIHGTSLAYTFSERSAPTRKSVQYFEILGDRGIWQQGWKAVARHPKGSDFSADTWELYHLSADFSETEDLAKREPARLQAMIQRWWDEARTYGVLPLDDRDWERGAIRLRMNRRTRYEYFGDMSRVDRLASPDISDRSYSVTARFHSGDQPPQGMLVSYGTRFGGYALYVKGGAVHYEYAYSESERHAISAPLPARADEVEVRVEFRRTARNAGEATLLVAGARAAAVTLPRTWPTHGTVAGLTCGFDGGAPVSDAYAQPFRFTGKGLRVTIELGEQGEVAPGELFGSVIREQ